MNGIGRLTSCVGVFVLSLATAWAGNVCTWKGGSGKFSDDNWDPVAPVSGNGDTIVIDSTLNDGAAITLENDVADEFAIDKITFVNSEATKGKVTLNGKSLYFNKTSGSSTVIWSSGPDNGNTTYTDQADRGPVTEVNCALRVKGGRFSTSNTTTFNGAVTIDDNGYVLLRQSGENRWVDAHYYFKGSIYGPQATIGSRPGVNGNGSGAYFSGKLTLKRLNCATDGNAYGYTQISTSGNSIGDVRIAYTTLFLSAPDVFLPSTIIRSPNSKYACGNGVTILMTGDQTIDRVEREAASDNPLSFRNNDAYERTLTMKATANATFDGRFNNKVYSSGDYSGSFSVIYDPTNAYTYTHASTLGSTMGGTLDICGGTWKVSGATYYSRVTAIKVRKGATLDLTDSTRFGTSTAVFNTNATLYVEHGGLVKLPADTSLTFASVKAEGVMLPADTYTATEDWIEGGSVIASSGPAAGVTCWRKAADGQWNTAANWTAGVPTADTTVAYITAEGSASGYTVDFDGVGAAMPKKLVIATDKTTETATLAVTNKLAFETVSKFEIGKGGKISVRENGTWIHDLKNTGYGATADYSAERLHYTIDHGGIFEVDGGYVSWTNFIAHAEIGADASTTSTLRIASGTFQIWDCSGNSRRRLWLEQGGRIEQTGGVFDNPSINYASIIAQEGGSIDVSGGLFNPRSGGSDNQWAFGTGVSKFSGNAEFGRGGNNRYQMHPATVNQMSELTFEDSSFIGGSQLYFNIGSRTGGKSIVRWNTTGSASIGKVFIGCYCGSTEFTQSAGRFYIGTRGLLVGANPSIWGGGESTDYNWFAPTGLVRVTGGAMTVSGSGALDSDWYQISPSGSETPFGTVLGDGVSGFDLGAKRPYRGDLEVTGGSFTNQQGQFFVGLGYGVGRICVDGGHVVSADSGSAYKGQAVFAVGVGGGLGEVVVSNGLLKINNNTFVGGVWTNAFRALLKYNQDGSLNRKYYGYPYDRHDGSGLLRIAGGATEFGKKLVVGSEGEGTIEVCGSTGTFALAGDMVLSNRATFVTGGTPSATLRFTPDATGVTTLNVGGKLAISDSAKLSVDLSAYTGRNSLVLMRYASCEGSFAAGNVTVTGGTGPASGARVALGPTRMRLVIPNGTMIMVR